MRLDAGLLHLDRRRYALHRVRTSASWSYPEHDHRGYCEILQVEAGSLEHRIGGRCDHLTAGGLALVRESDRHALAGSGLRYYNLNLHISDVRRAIAYLDGGPALAAALATAEPLLPVQVPPSETTEVAGLFATLFERQASDDAGLVLQSGLVQLLGRFAKPDVTPGVGLPSWLEQALAAARKRLADTGPGRLARQAGVSPAHLARSMRRHLGITPSAWLNAARLEQAAIRLTHSDESILGISLDLGFRHLGWFYRQFRRAYGCAPAAYRRRNGSGASPQPAS